MVFCVRCNLKQFNQNLDNAMSTVRPLSEPLAKLAREQLNEDAKNIEESINIFREWILKQSHLKARIDDQFLLTFLRASKFSIEMAKQKIDGYYTIRSGVPELFSNRDVDDPKLREIFKLGIGLSLPNTKGDDGPRISIIRAGNYDTRCYNVKDIIKAGTFVGDIQILEDDNLIVAGLIEIIDMSNITAGHLLQMDVAFLKKLAKVGEDGTPLRHKGLHFINAPPGFDTIFNIFKGFLSEKSRKRICSHGTNMESLYKYVPRRLLPLEYGGENGTIPEIIEYWEKKITSYRDYFLEEEQYGVIEAFRPATKLGEKTEFGVNGTFRQLCLD